MKGNPYEGLWVDPDGERIEVVEHLADLARSPERYELTAREVRGVGLHGMRKLAERLIREGWVRYRYLSGEHLFELYQLNKDMIDKVLAGTDALKDDMVLIETVRPKREYRGTVDQWFDRSMLRTWESNPKRTWRLS